MWTATTQAIIILRAYILMFSNPGSNTGNHPVAWNVSIDDQNVLTCSWQWSRKVYQPKILQFYVIRLLPQVYVSEHHAWHMQDWRPLCNLSSFVHGTKYQVYCNRKAHFAGSASLERSRSQKCNDLIYARWQVVQVSISDQHEFRSWTCL